MLDFLKNIQVPVFIGCGIVCFMLAFFILIIKFHSVNKKKALMRIQLTVAVHMIAEACAYIYDGDSSPAGYWVVRISNFLVYICLLGSMFFLASYITTLFMEGGKFEKLPKRLSLGLVLPTVGMSLVVLSQFFGFYYYFDENNFYHRGPLFAIGFIFPLCISLMLFQFVLQHRKIIHRRLVYSLIIFSVLPIVAASVQIFLYGLSLLDFAIWQSAVTMYWFALMDQNEELVAAASTELATGLPNTFGFVYEVEQIKNSQDITKYDGYYMDIVRMSHLNNKYGKRLGDRIIIDYARYIRNSIDKDEIVARLGGNYFTALIKRENAERFLKLLADVPVEVELGDKKETAHIATSAGIYQITNKNVVSEQIITNCSIALSYAKNEAHKPYVYLDEHLEKEFDRVRMLEENSRKALGKKEFEPFYQPKVDSKTGMLCGAEALARWRSEGKLVSPGEFIPVMEKNSSICDLDFYMLETVCKDIKEWLVKGAKPVTISVNFSRRNLGNPILAEAISKVVEKYEIPKDLIQIEITETLDEYPMSYLSGVVDALHRYGMTAAIDDFGTGSSSIKLLKDVNFDVLKIDKSFVDYETYKDKALLKDIISMAKSREISVVAEGVEKLAQVDELAAMGCYMIQGYVFDRPLEKTEFEKRLENKKYT